MLKVGFLGAKGKVGKALVPLLEASEKYDFTVGLSSGDDMNELVTTGTQVCIDFTTPTAVLNNVLFLLEHNISAIVGTTGLKEDDLQVISTKLAEKPDLAVIVAPNFAIGAVLAMYFAAKAAPYFQTVEIVEGHNPLKVDAPSGTAIATAKAINDKRVSTESVAIEKVVKNPSSSRGEQFYGVPIHALRGAGMVAHEKVLFGNSGEIFTISHDSISRESFWPGVELALDNIASISGLVVGIQDFLDLD